MRQHPNATEDHVINDRCGIVLSIKDAEHKKETLYSSVRKEIFIPLPMTVFPITE
jgi:hypothetical protein